MATNDTGYFPQPTPSFVSLGLSRWLVPCRHGHMETDTQATCIRSILKDVLYYFSSQCHHHSGLYIPKGVRLTTALQNRIAYCKVSVGRDCWRLQHWFGGLCSSNFTKMGRGSVWGICTYSDAHKVIPSPFI